MSEQEVIHHLLEIEAKASAIVEEARAQADKRLLEADGASRAAYDHELKERLGELEQERQAQAQAIQAESKAALDSYRASLDTITTDQAAFQSLVSRYLSGDA